MLGGGTTYAESFLEIARGGDYWLRLETPNTHAVFVDERSVARVDRRTTTAPRTSYHRVRLEAGRHEITVAMATRHPNPILYVAVVGDDGLRPSSSNAASGFSPDVPEIHDTATAHLRASVELTRGDVVGARETLDAVIANGRSGGPELALRATIALSDPLRPEDIARDDATRAAPHDGRARRAGVVPAARARASLRGGRA